jgi:multidrug transporter EmrE-like cation transporter
MRKFADHFYIAATILLTVYSQLVMRWQVGKAGTLPGDFSGKVNFVGSMLLNPWVISGIIATFLAGVSWMLAMSRFQLSYAFPFVSLNYALVLLASAVLFNETLTPSKLLGLGAIVVGIIVIARG